MTVKCDGSVYHIDVDVDMKIKMESHAPYTGSSQKCILRILKTSDFLYKENNYKGLSRKIFVAQINLLFLFSIFFSANLNNKLGLPVWNT